MQMLSRLITSPWASSEAMLGALLFGFSIALVALLVVSAHRALNIVAVWLAASRVEALSAQCGLPGGDALTRPLLYAFRHSSRLRRQAEAFVDILRTRGPSGRDAPRINRKEIGNSDVSQSMLVGDNEPANAVLTIAFNYFPAITIFAGALGLITVVALCFLALTSQTVGLPDRFNFPGVFNVLIRSGMFEIGCGIVGLLSLVVRRLLSRTVRRLCQKLQQAVEDCLAASATAVAPLPYQVRLLRELGQVRRIAEEESRARTQYTAMLKDAFAHIEEMIRISRTNAGTNGDGMTSAIRQLGHDLTDVRDRMEGLLARHFNFIATVGAFAAMPDIRESLDRLTVAAESIHESCLRLASIVDSLTNMASAVGQYVGDQATRPVEQWDAIHERAIAELNVLMSQFDDDSALLSIDIRDEDGFQD